MTIFLKPIFVILMLFVNINTKAMDGVAQQLQGSLSGKNPLCSVTVTRKGSSVLQSAERYFLGKIIECFLNNSDVDLNYDVLEMNLKNDVAEFRAIYGKIKTNEQAGREAFIQTKSQLAAEKIHEIDDSISVNRIKNGLIRGTLSSSLQDVIKIIALYKEQTSAESIRTHFVGLLTTYEKSVYEKKHRDINAYKKRVIDELSVRIHEIDDSISINRIKNGLIRGTLSSSLQEVKKVIEVYKQFQLIETSPNTLDAWSDAHFNIYIDSLKNDYHKIWNKLQTIRRKYNSKLEHVKGNYGLVVFNEMFFGKNIPFDEEKTKQLDDFVKALSTACSNKILFSNILSTNEIPLEKEQVDSLALFFANELTILDEIDNSDFSRANQLTNLFSSRIPLKEYIKELRRVEGHNTLQLVNITNAFFGGDKLYFYEKSSYCEECDSLLKQGALYKFGDKKNHKIHDSVITTTALDNIVNAICYDFNLGIHKDIDLPQKIYILQSNTLKLEGYHQNLPQKSHILIHSDPNIILLKNLLLCKTDLYEKKYIENIKDESREPFVLQNSGNLILAILLPILSETYTISIREIIIN